MKHIMKAGVLSTCSWPVSYTHLDVYKRQGHNGLKNISAHLGTDGFARIKMGVGNKPEGSDLADLSLIHILKPMNCPGGMLVYKSQPRSYRELPLRMGELGIVHRNEKSGQLHGLMPVSYTHLDVYKRQGL